MVYIADLTGGGDSRATISMLLAQDDFNFETRCMGIYPSPDANVAGYLMKVLGLVGCAYPIPQIPSQVTAGRIVAVQSWKISLNAVSKTYALEINLSI